MDARPRHGPAEAEETKVSNRIGFWFWRLVRRAADFIQTRSGGLYTHAHGKLMDIVDKNLSKRRRHAKR